MWALVRLLIADKHDRMTIKDTRDALWCAYKIRRVTDDTANAEAAVLHAMDMLDMFNAEVSV
jgi:hypothetical protein